MNRACTLATLALTLMAGSVSQAAEKSQPQEQPATAILQSAPKGTVAFDDDGGRAQIIPRKAADTAAARDATFHNGPVITRGTVQAVFLGSGWREKTNRGKESRVMESLHTQGAGAAASLDRYGIGEWESPRPALEDPAGDPVAGKTISDLEIQIRLDNLLSGETLQANSVYVVFLAPGLGSTLGSKTSARDFAAYHNHFHASGGVVHYVVVPYDNEPARWLAAARQSLAQALINPEGNGWY